MLKSVNKMWESSTEHVILRLVQTIWLSARHWRWQWDDQMLLGPIKGHLLSLKGSWTVAIIVDQAMKGCISPGVHVQTDRWLVCLPLSKAKIHYGENVP